jgi:hypothetical protein
MAESQRYGVQVDVNIEAKNAYVFNKNYRKPLGYIFKMKFASGTELKDDITVKDPENPNSDLKVVAVMDGGIHWLGGPTDPISLSGRLSEENKAKLNTCINSLDGGAEVDISWAVVNYDYSGKAYYKYFHTDGKEAKLVITPGTMVQVNSEVCDDIKSPEHYLFSGSFTAKGDAGPQELFCAENTGAKITKQLGGVGAPG